MAIPFSFEPELAFKRRQSQAGELSRDGIIGAFLGRLQFLYVLQLLLWLSYLGMLVITMLTFVIGVLVHLMAELCLTLRY